MSETLVIDKQAKATPIEYPTTHEARKEPKTARHFVTGGAGFIGSHIIDRLLANKNNLVTVFDNLSSGSKDNIKQHEGNPRLSFIYGDLIYPNAVEKAIRGHDIVWHLGANTDIRTGNEDTGRDLDNCTIATYNLLEAMKDNDVKILVFASSATVYGDAPNQWLREDYAPLLPISLYGAAKLGCEGLISAYSHLFGIKSLIFRFANVVGSRMNHGVIYDFINKLRRNPAELEILGDGNQEKSYFLVEECLDGMFHMLDMLAMKHNISSKGTCDIFNLGADTTTTATRVAEIVCEVMGLRNVKFTYAGGRQGWLGDAPMVLYNVSKAKALGWKTEHTSDEAVRIATERILGE